MLRDTLEGEPPNLFSALQIAPLGRGLCWCFGLNRVAWQPTIKLNHDSEEKHVD
jgi:hypothetical protein